MGKPSLKAEFRLDNVKKLQKYLDELPRRAVKKCTKQSSDAGGRVVRKDMKARAPKESGLLKKGIASKSKVYPSGNAVNIVGVRKDAVGEYHGKKRVPAKYLHLILFGAKPHWIEPTSGPFALARILHPGVQHPQNFVAEAIQASKSEAGKAMETKLYETLRAESRKINPWRLW